MKTQHNTFISSAIKYLFLFLFILMISNSYAQNKYKILFKEDLAKQPIEVKAYLQKLSNTEEATYNVTDNSVIISTTASIDKTILTGKLEKLKASVKTIDLMNNEVNISSTEKSTSTSTQTEIQKKAAKSQQQQLERQYKPISSSPYRRY